MPDTAWPINRHRQAHCGGGRRSAMVVDWVVAAIIVGEIAAGMQFG
jgi:hypothetical protein